MKQITDFNIYVGKEKKYFKLSDSEYGTDAQALVDIAIHIKFKYKVSGAKVLTDSNTYPDVEIDGYSQDES